ncbi:acyl carrier protein [Pseudoalteromonas denitrificans]|uniref:Phosphopantetheine attachment site n=1 Tax=Pseudoalteromonas denitrificans DSM 6059 TaxID=1123010 RepID=A0A1I1PHM6_9GAMM|nr:acyl carrier protein [Pseudoalteromonas denitrificans]SFD09354.1 Phosphopantetheine attachment site [Pseudoalteromonas denitrificans DSM 6059]
MNLEIQLKTILKNVLNQNTNHFTLQSPLLGEYAELDSMGIMSLLMQIESDLKIDINAINLTAETFETFGSLLQNIQFSLSHIDSAA